MKETLAWLNAALAGRDVGGGMDYYKVNDQAISASDGLITACAPWQWGGKFFVPGAEFEKIIKRLPGEISLSMVEGGIKLRSGRFNGFIEALPLEEWSYPGIDEAPWQAISAETLETMRALRPFVSENPLPAWGNCIAMENGWMLATNNIVIAGCESPEIGSASALLPARSIDFILNRTKGLQEWAFDENFMAFRWKNGSWMRSQLIIGSFPERAAELVRSSANIQMSQAIDKDFLEAIERVGELAEDTVAIYADRIEARFGKAVIDDGIECETPEESECSIFGAKYLLPMLKAAEAWSPSLWPKPVPWKGKEVSGYIVGRRM